MSAPGYWPFWLCGAALAGVTVGFMTVFGRAFGVSGLFGRLLEPGAREEERTLDEMTDAELEAALAEATAAAFGADAMASASAAPATPAATERPDAGRMGSRFRVDEALVFLVAVALGGLLASLSTHGAGLRGLEPAFARLFGQGPLAYLVLLVGGALMGAGTQMAAGCTTGHGLVGCGRLQPGSLVGTACFFGTGIGVSFALAAVLP